MKHLLLVVMLVVCLLIPLTAAQAGLPDERSLLSADGLSWQSQLAYDRATLTILGPDGILIEQNYAGGEPLFWSAAGADYPNGQYSYELVLQPPAADASTVEIGRESVAILANAPKAETVNGEFGLYKGRLVPVSSDVSMLDVVHVDDTIVQSSLCVGVDCNNGEVFGFDTLRLKENNLRIHFQDTSNSSTFPTRDWRIVINDSSASGANYFAVQDADSTRYPFLIEGGAPAYALYVEDYGRVGMGTNTPVVELHIQDGDTPTMRLEQDGSGGWPRQTWDVAGNESNFFVRDATNGSRLPFRIQPGTPSSTLCLKSDGQVGLGTWSPAYTMEIEKNGQDASLAVERVDGQTGYLTASAGSVKLGSVYTNPLTVWIGTDQVAEFGADGTFVVGQDGEGQAYLDADAGGARFGSVTDEPIKFVVNGNVVAQIDKNGNLSVTGTIGEGAALGSVEANEVVQVDLDRLAALEAELATQAEHIAGLEARLEALEAALAAQPAPADARLK